MPLVTDTFNRADENPLSFGGKWSAPGTFNPMLLSVNAAKASVNAIHNLSAWTGDAFSADHYSQCLVKGGGAPYLQGPAVRCAAAGAYYGAMASPGTTTLELSRLDSAGTRTLLGTAAYVPSFPFTLKLTASGTTLTLYAEGVQKIQMTDDTLASGSPALTAWATDASLDDFQADDLAVTLTVDRIFPLRSALALAVDRALPLHADLGLLIDRILPFRLWVGPTWDRAFPLQATGIIQADRILPLRGRREQATDRALPLVFLLEQNVLAVRDLPLRVGTLVARDAVLPLSSGPYPIALTVDRVLPLRALKGVRFDRTLPVRSFEDAGWTKTTPGTDGWTKTPESLGGAGAFQSNAFQDDAFQQQVTAGQEWRKKPAGVDGWTKA